MFKHLIVFNSNSGVTKLREAKAGTEVSSVASGCRLVAGVSLLEKVTFEESDQ